MATIFLSHSSRDDALASMLEAWLKGRGFDDIFSDHDSIRSGDKWTETLRRASGSCRVVLSLVTPDWLASSECFGEFTAGWYAGRRMIPLLSIRDAKLDDLQKQRLSRVLLEDQGVDISRVGAPQALDFEGHPEVTEPFVEGLRAAGALAKVGLDPSVFTIDDRRDPEGNLVKPPFPGLESFGDTDADAAILYGRSSEIAQVLEDLREFRAGGDRRAYAHIGRAYVIQGSSGSGKSSLLKAGVLPRLRRERGWVALRSFRPGADPLLSFSEALTKPLGVESPHQAPGAIRDRLLNHWRTANSDAETARASVSKTMPGEAQQAKLAEIDLTKLQTIRRELDAEVAPIKAKLDRPAATVLIAADQGEELVDAEGESGDALADYLRAALLPAPQDEPAHYAAVLTVRTDSFQEMQTSARLEGLATRLFDLRPLPIYRFAEAIEQPASRYGVEIEPLLVEMLMEDAGGRDALPLLAFTLQRLWRQYERERRIRKVNYESIGKLLGLIEDAAERALRGYDPAAQQGPLSGKVPTSRDTSAQRAFLPALAQVNERGGAIRRVATLSNFDEEGKDILASFEKWRLVVTTGPDVEVAHEALFRAWPRFLRWLEPERARLEAMRGLESAAISWDSNGRDNDFISHNGRRLRDATALLKMPEFRKLIDRNTAVKDYLSTAGRSALGWWIANRYLLTIACLAVAFTGVGLPFAYFSGYHGAVPLALFVGGVTLGVVVVLGGLPAYLAAFFRQIALHAGVQYDAIVAVLTAALSAAAEYFYFRQKLSLLAERSIASIGADVKPQWNFENIFNDVDNTVFGIVGLADWVFTGLLIPLACWAVVQFLWLFIVPIGLLVQKIRRMRRAAKPSESDKLVRSA